MNIYFHAIFYIKLYVRVMSARYLCLFVGPSGLQAVGTKSSFSSSVLTPMYCRCFKSCDYSYAVVLLSPYVVILYILAILLESAGSEEREQFDVGDYSAVWSELHYFQTSTG